MDKENIVTPMEKGKDLTIHTVHTTHIHPPYTHLPGEFNCVTIQRKWNSNNKAFVPLSKKSVGGGFVTLVGPREYNGHSIIMHVGMLIKTTFLENSLQYIHKGLNLTLWTQQFYL